MAGTAEMVGTAGMVGMARMAGTTGTFGVAGKVGIVGVAGWLGWLGFSLHVTSQSSSKWSQGSKRVRPEAARPFET